MARSHAGQESVRKVTRIETGQTFCPPRSHALIERHSSWVRMRYGNGLTGEGKRPEQRDGLVHIKQKLAPLRKRVKKNAVSSCAVRSAWNGDGSWKNSFFFVSTEDGT